MISPVDKSFWETQHTANNPTWLTGTTLNLLLTKHGLTTDFLRDKKILEIGVGLGHCTREFQQYAKELYGSDISQAALDRVADFVTAGFLSNNLSQAPAVDLAFSHLVFVHCTDQEVERIINDVNLTDDGVFTFQVSGLKDNIITERVQAQLIDNGSHFFRGVDVTKAIIARTNKEIISITTPVYGGDYFGNWVQHEWYYVQVKNKGNTS
jgi:predicted TPR repeat methyltransferase